MPEPNMLSLLRKIRTAVDRYNTQEVSWKTFKRTEDREPSWELRRLLALLGALENGDISVEVFRNLISSSDAEVEARLKELAKNLL